MADIEALIRGEVTKAGMTIEGDGTATSDGSEGDTAIEVENDAPEAAEGEETASGEATETAEGADAGDASENDTQTSDKAAKEGETAAEGDVDAEVDEFAKEHGLAEKDKTGRVNRIPYPRVKKIAANAVAKATAPLTAKITELEGTHKATSEELTDMKRGEWVMINNCEKFLELLPQVNPRYAELLNKRTENHEVKPPSDRPTPDLDLGDGKRTYSPDGLTKLFDWFGGTLEKKVLEASNKSLKPLMDRNEADKRIYMAAENLQRTVNTARAEWPGFKDYEADIDTALKGDKAGKLTLWTAYLQVKEAKHKAALEASAADEKKLRVKWLKEQTDKPSSTSTTVRTTATKKSADDGPKSTEDVIRESLKTAGMLK